MASLKVYISSVSSNQELKKHQTRIMDVLTSKKIEFESVDVASDRIFLVKMREIAGNEAALPPQICRGEDYIGDYSAFDEAVEDSRLMEFLKC